MFASPRWRRCRPAPSERKGSDKHGVDPADERRTPPRGNECIGEPGPVRESDKGESSTMIQGGCTKTNNPALVK
jgi:hypothetical protein